VVKVIPVIVILLLPLLVSSQVNGTREEKGYRTASLIVDGDTLPVLYTEQYNVVGTPSMRSNLEAQKWDRLVRNVKVAYPYARLAGLKFEEYNKKLSTINSEKEKKQMMKQAEDELQAQYGEELKKLTFTQGKILIKLVDRQTSFSSYDILKEFRGRFVAFFWQGIGKIFGYNLKTKYDPLQEDADIERIVLMIENGTL
jgi:hypothetical protein